MQRFRNIACVLAAVCFLGCAPQLANAQGSEPLVGRNCSVPPTMRTLRYCCWGGERTMIDDLADKCVKEIKSRHYDDKLDEEICKYECVFKETGIFTADGDIDHDAVKKCFSKALDDSSLVDLMCDVFEACDSKVDLIIKNIRKRPSDEEECSPYPNLMRLCVSNFGILNCPDDRWNDNEECNSIKAAQATCPFENSH